MYLENARTYLFWAKTLKAIDPLKANKYNKIALFFLNKAKEYKQDNVVFVNFKNQEITITDLKKAC